MTHAFDKLQVTVDGFQFRKNWIVQWVYNEWVGSVIKVVYKFIQQSGCNDIANQGSALSSVKFDVVVVHIGCHFAQVIDSDMP